MSQHDFNIANQSGAAFRADLNLVLAAILSQNSGVAEPTTTSAFMPWVDTSGAVPMLKLRNAANNGWILVAALDTYALASVQKQASTYFTTDGSGTAYTITPSPELTANTAGTRLRASFHTAAGGNPTFAASGLTALSIKYKDANGVKQTATSVQIPTNWVADVECDGTDWVLLDIAAQTPPGQTNLTSAYTVVAADKNKVLCATTGTWTMSLTGASTLGLGFQFAVLNSGTGTITIDPLSAETIDGLATIAVPPNSMVSVYCDGSKFTTNGFSLAQLKAIDGSGSGLDADMLDGSHASSFASSSAFTGCSYTPSYGGTGLHYLMFTRSNGGTHDIQIS